MPFIGKPMVVAKEVIQCFKIKTSVTNMIKCVSKSRELIILSAKNDATSGKVSFRHGMGYNLKLNLQPNKKRSHNKKSLPFNSQ